MPATPPNGAPVAPPQTDPPTTRHAAVPIDAREWRIRTESRCNAILTVALALIVGAGVTVTTWLAVAGLVTGGALLIGQAVMRPALPWRSPTRRQVDEADLAVMNAPALTPPYPIAAAMPARTAAQRGAPRLPVELPREDDDATARVERVRPAR